MTTEYKTQDEVIADRRASRIRGLRHVAQHLYVSEVNSRSVVESEQIKAMHSVILDILKDYEHEHEKAELLRQMRPPVQPLKKGQKHMTTTDLTTTTERTTTAPALVRRAIRIEMDKVSYDPWNIRCDGCPMKPHTDALGQTAPICASGVIINLQSAVLINTCKYYIKESFRNDSGALTIGCSHMLNAPTHVKDNERHADSTGKENT